VIPRRDVVALVDVTPIQLAGPSQLRGGFGCLSEPVLYQSTPEPVVGRLWFDLGGLPKALVRLGEETENREGLSEHEPVARLRVVKLLPQFFEVPGGLGIDNIAWISWYLNGGGKALYDELWSEMGMNIKGLMLQPVGPEALGWFKEPINSMDDFRKYRFRTPPGIPGQSYKDIGVAAVAMGGGDILPALEAGTIDAAEWCCPKPDSVFGFQKVLKHYYLQGLHQVVVNADMYINGDVWNSLTPDQQNAMQVAADASLMRSLARRIYENGKALKDLTENHGVILHDTPADYFTEYMAATEKLYAKLNAENAFFAKVYASMKEFADIAVPFWAGAQMSNANLGMAYAKQKQ